MLAQILFVLFVVLATFWIWRWRDTAHGRAWKRILLLGFAGVVVIAILFPDAATEVANLIGIGRGTDLIAYLTAFSVMLMAVLVYMKFQRLDDRLARLTRSAALAEWQREQGLFEEPERDER